LHRSSCCAVALVVGALLVAGAAAAAPTFTVNSIADVALSPSVHDGHVCETATGNGVCTLRAAVMAANQVNGGGATIRVPAGTYYLSIPGTPQSGDAATADLDVLQPMTIVGDGPSATIIDGNHLTPVFWIRLLVSGETARIEGVTIQNGNGSPLYNGGGIAAAGGTVLENVVVAGNSAWEGGGIAQAADVDLTLQHCILRDNHAGSHGGGLFTEIGRTQVLDSLIKSNSAGGHGGGVSNRGVTGAYWTTTIERTAVLANTAATDGGGIYNETGQLDVVNSTLWENSAEAYGGGIGVGGGTTALISDTISENLANSKHANLGFLSQGGPFGGGVGIASIDDQNSVTMRNTVLFWNVSGLYQSTALRADEAGLYSVFSLDYDICSAWLSCFLSGITTHVNQADIDPQLGPLASNGGFSYDELPYPPSPLVRAVPAPNCVDAQGGFLAEDARGLARVGDCDIGAVQTDAAYAPATLLGSELIRNGGAAGNELGEAAPVGDGAPPYWALRQGTIAQSLYGAPGFPAAGDAPAGSGSYFFASGNSDVSRIQQLLDVSALAAQIDAGQIRFSVSGAFGGRASEDDFATLTLYFDDAAPSLLGVASIGGFHAAERGNATKLIHDSKQGVVPVGTRRILAELYAARISGPENDGYADDLSLRLPEPAQGALAVAALLALACVPARPRAASSARGRATR